MDDNAFEYFENTHGDFITLSVRHVKSDQHVSVTYQVIQGLEKVIVYGDLLNLLKGLDLGLSY